MLHAKHQLIEVLMGRKRELRRGGYLPNECSRRKRTQPRSRTGATQVSGIRRTVPCTAAASAAAARCSYVREALH